MTQLCLRIDDRLRRLIEDEAGRTGLGRSEIARQAMLRGFVGPCLDDPRTLDEKLRPYVGAVNLGIPDLGERHHDYVRDRIRARAGLPD